MSYGFQWELFYLKNKKIVNYDGDQIFSDCPDFVNTEDAEQWLIDIDERGNVVGDWADRNEQPEKRDPEEKVFSAMVGGREE